MASNCKSQVDYFLQLIYVMRLVIALYIVLLSSKCIALKSLSKRFWQPRVGLCHGDLGRLLSTPRYARTPTAEVLCSTEGCSITGGSLRIQI